AQRRLDLVGPEFCAGVEGHLCGGIIRAKLVPAPRVCELLRTPAGLRAETDFSARLPYGSHCGCSRNRIDLGSLRRRSAWRLKKLIVRKMGCRTSDRHLRRNYNSDVHISFVRQLPWESSSVLSCS